MAEIEFSRRHTPCYLYRRADLGSCRSKVYITAHNPANGFSRPTVASLLSAYPDSTPFYFGCID